MANISVAQNKVSARNLIDGFSLEMTGKDVTALNEAHGSIPPGAKVNVTFLGNEDLEMRVTAAQAVKDLGFTPVPHISARRLKDQHQLEEFLGQLQEVGASEHVFVVGGDPATPEGPYAHSLAVIQTGLLQKYGVKEVSIAGYPEGHPDIDDEALWWHLDAKITALKEQGLHPVIITQFGFNADAMLNWIKEVRNRGIDAPIRIGTPGPAGIKRLMRFAGRFGVGANAMIVKKYGFSLSNLLGTAGPDKFIGDLADALAKEENMGRVKIHFYTFGGLLATADWAHEYATANE